MVSVFSLTGPPALPYPSSGTLLRLVAMASLASLLGYAWSVTSKEWNRLMHSVNGNMEVDSHIPEAFRMVWGATSAAASASVPDAWDTFVTAWKNKSKTPRLSALGPEDIWRAIDAYVPKGIPVLKAMDALPGESSALCPLRPA